jgi:S-adenosylmethionine hydrolase
VLWIDRFGNLVTNVTAEVMAAAGIGPKLVATCCRQTTLRHVRSYGEAAAGDFITLVGSSDRFELAVVNGSAAAGLGARIGDRVTITW